MKAMFRWVVALGITGLLCGYVGPIVFDPDANQGPLLGIFITGPAGAVAGLVLGVLARVLPWSPAVERKALLASCAVLALGTLWYSLPGPRTRGMLLEASVTGCILPDALEEAALADWDSRIAKVTWAAPRVGWEGRREATVCAPRRGRARSRRDGTQRCAGTAQALEQRAHLDRTRSGRRRREPCVRALRRRVMP